MYRVIKMYVDTVQLSRCFLVERCRDANAACKLRRPRGSCDEQKALPGIGILVLFGTFLAYWSWAPEKFFAGFLVALAIKQFFL
jgi:hypothetical protein